MTEPIVALRAGDVRDVDDLLRVERAANLVALAHVFPPEQYPYPDDDVRERWLRVLHDPLAQVAVAERNGEVVGFVAWRRDVVEHLGVHPDAQRRGVGTRLLTHAVSAIGSSPRLWVLVDNSNARAMYSSLGWAATGHERRAEFPPYPAEVELRLGG